MYDFVSFFTGGCGLDRPLEQTGRFRLRACVDNSTACCEAIRRNWVAGRVGDRSLRIHQCDVRRLDPSALLSGIGLARGDLPLLAGAPPCQSFSPAGKRRGVQDARGMLIWDFLRLVDAIRPWAFLMENVSGLMLAAMRPRPVHERPGRGGPPLADDERPGSVIREFFRRLPQGYRVDCFLVNAANYGCPQIRERVVLVGNRFGRLAEFPTPTHGGPGQPPYRTLGEALAGLADPDPTVMYFTPRRERLMAKVPPGGNWTSLTADEAREGMGVGFYADGGQSHWFRRLSFDRPCLTVLTKPNSVFTPLCHPSETRPLSLAECARVQEFPDGWEFAGNDRDRYAQVGNAVPASLGRACGEAVAGLLDGIVPGMEPEEGHPPWRIVHIRPQVRIPWVQAGA